MLSAVLLFESAVSYPTLVRGVVTATPERRRQKKYAGTPVATTTRPTAARPGCVTIAFTTIAADASTNSAGVRGYPGTRNGRSASGSLRRSGNTAAAPSP